MVLTSAVNADCGSAAADEESKRRKRRRKRRGRGQRKKTTPEEILASLYVRRWAFPDASLNDADGDDPDRAAGQMVFEFHSHSTCSDGFLSPTALVERAHARGVSPSCPRCSDEIPD